MAGGAGGREGWAWGALRPAWLLERDVGVLLGGTRGCRGSWSRWAARGGSCPSRGGCRWPAARFCSLATAVAGRQAGPLGWSGPMQPPRWQGSVQRLRFASLQADWTGARHLRSRLEDTQDRNAAQRNTWPASRPRAAREQPAAQRRTADRGAPSWAPRGLNPRLAAARPRTGPACADARGPLYTHWRLSPTRPIAAQAGGVQAGPPCFSMDRC